MVPKLACSSVAQNVLLYGFGQNRATGIEPSPTGSLTCYTTKINMPNTLGFRVMSIINMVVQNSIRELRAMS